MKLMGMELEEAGYIPDKSEVKEPAEQKPERRYATIYVDDRELPAIKAKDLSDDCVLVAIVHVKSREESETEEKGKKETRVSMMLEIRHAAIKPYKKEKEPEEMSDEELEKGE